MPEMEYKHVPYSCHHYCCHHDYHHFYILRLLLSAGEPIDKPLYIHRQSCYLFGRERRVADVPLDHPSISKQHAILQYRCAHVTPPPVPPVLTPHPVVLPQSLHWTVWLRAMRHTAVQVHPCEPSPGSCACLL